MTRNRTEQSQRYRFSVPGRDISVKQWIEGQSDLSLSLRILIKEDMKQHGVRDLACMPVEVPSPVSRRAASKEPKVLARPAQPVSSVQSVQQMTATDDIPAVTKTVQNMNKSTGTAPAELRLDDDGFADPSAFFNI